MVLLMMGCLTQNCPAPFVFTPGEGWSYESPGSAGDWMRDRAVETTCSRAPPRRGAHLVRAYSVSFRHRQ